MKRLVALLVTMMVGVSLLIAPKPALASGYTWGDYRDVPYRDLVKIRRVDFGRGTYVEISEKDIFSPKLDRTVTLGDFELDSVVIVARMWDQIGNEGMKYYVFDLFEQPMSPAVILFDELNADYLSPEEKEARLPATHELAKERMVLSRLGSLWRYPDYEIVSINGKPWQETVWKDTIISVGLEDARRAKADAPIVVDPQVRNLFMNPDYNGKAREVHEEIEAGKPLPTPQVPSISSGNRVILTLGSREVVRYVDGKAEHITLDVAPEAPGGYTMVPVRGVLDAFGAQLTYNGTANTVTIADPTTTVVLTIGDAKATVNGRIVEMGRPAEVKNGRALIPVRFVSENLGYEVKWEPEFQRVTIIK